MEPETKRRVRIGVVVGSFVLALISTALMVAATVKMFRVSVRDAKDQDVGGPDSPLERYFSCDEQGEEYALFGSGIGKLYRYRCIVEQAPYAALFIASAAFVLATSLIAIVALMIASPGALYSFSTVSGVTMALLIVSAAAFLHALQPLATFIPCDSLSETKARIAEKTGIGVCVIGSDGAKKTVAFELFHWLIVWGVAWIIGFIAVSVMIGMMSGIASRVAFDRHYLSGESLSPGPAGLASFAPPKSDYQDEPARMRRLYPPASASSRERERHGRDAMSSLELAPSQQLRPASVPAPSLIYPTLASPAARSGPGISRFTSG